MKHGKKPTRAQKIFIKKHGLTPDKWLVVRNALSFLEIQHRESRITRKLDREVI